MLTIMTNKGLAKAYFSYVRQEVPANPVKATSKPHVKPVSASCRIVSADNETLLSSGTAQCHPNDIFRYEKARKITFKRAIENMNMSVEERTAAWNVFHGGKYN